MSRSLQYLFTLSIYFVFSSNVFAAKGLGEIITLDGSKYRILSENLIPNPGFEDGFANWTDATTSAATLSSANFNIVPSGGINNSSYLVGTRNESSSSAGSIGTGWSLEPGKKYYFSYHVKYLDASAVAGMEEWLKVSLTNNKTSSAEPKILMNSTSVESGGQWTRNELVFTNEDPSYAYLVVRFRWLSNRFGFDEFALHEVVEIVNIDDLQAIIEEAQEIYEPDTPGATDFLLAIESAEGFLNSESPSEVLAAIEELQEAITAYKFQNASSDNPLDVTNYIINQGFDNNTPTGWRGIGTINHRVVEFYQRTFNMSQSITGLPAGKYTLRAQGFERPGGNDAGAAYQAGTETISAQLYADANSFPELISPFNSLYSEGYSAAGSLNGYLNTMAAASSFLSASDERYSITVPGILIEEGDTLRIGAKSDHQQSAYWVLFDNFQLEYHGTFDSDDLLDALDRQISKAQELLSLKITITDEENLNNAIDFAESTIADGIIDLEELRQVNSTINNAIFTAHKSKKAYRQLQNVIDDANDVFETLRESRKVMLMPLLEEANVLVDDSNVTIDELNGSISQISELIYKGIYVPTWMLGDVYNENNNWSITRSRESRNWIIFWEPGYGEDPSVLADGNYRINIDGLLEVAEESFDYYADSMKFITRGNSKTDDYKMIIRLRYTRDWEASGSGVDDMIGLLTLTAWSAQVGGHTLAHEVAHCFQYQVHCDNEDQNGWMYGFGPNASGGNVWWEMCAQWQAYKIYPELQFTDGRLANYYRTAHKHILHETPRYDNFFLPDYWTHLHGLDFIGRMWNESVRPEDPVEAYKRMTSINQSQFNDEMYDRATRFATWDIPGLRSFGESRINTRPQPRMNNAGDDFWIIDQSVTPANYGYNVIKLNAPSEATTLTVHFEGLAGIDGYRSRNVTAAGWRFGFVALLKDGTRVYSEMASASNSSPANQLSFDSPDHVDRLWLVVTGAPSFHWRHPWDDDNSNDEQWPYKVRFNNTNLLGRANVVSSTPQLNDVQPMIYGLENSLMIENLTYETNVMVYNLSGILILNDTVKNNSYSKNLMKGIYIVKLISNGVNVNQKVIIE
ncbi:DUF6055 domain-containing protein [Natronoflexus pectinivorans]|nr:DUF6055 domain-containing protein [Natronoflexus pectinivorans]